MGYTSIKVVMGWKDRFKTEIPLLGEKSLIVPYQGIDNQITAPSVEPNKGRRAELNWLNYPCRITFLQLLPFSLGASSKWAPLPHQLTHLCVVSSLDLRVCHINFHHHCLYHVTNLIGNNVDTTSKRAAAIKPGQLCGCHKNYCYTMFNLQCIASMRSKNKTICVIY